MSFGLERKTRLELLIWNHILSYFEQIVLVFR